LACRVIVDPIGSEDFDKGPRQRLTEGGCEVHRFRALGSHGHAMGRNHRKMVIIDGRRAITGGFGLARDWMGDGLSPGAWRDDAIEVEGPAVEEMQQSFAENWLESGGKLFARDDLPELKPAGRSPAVFVSSKEEAGGTDAYWMTRLLVDGARERLYIANAYFAPSDSMVRLLRRKRSEGVDVRILVPGPHNDQPLMRALQRSVYEGLLRGGVRIFEYQPSMMHSKTMAVDGRIAVVGSINLDPFSMNKLEEGSLLVEDPAVARRLEELFQQDCARSREITLENRPRAVLGRMLRPLRGLLNR
jgi:cardiolipin synthase